MDLEMAADYELVQGHMQPRCWRQWKGAEFGNAGRMTIRWAHENVAGWLNTLVSKYLFNRSCTRPSNFGLPPFVFGRVSGLNNPAVLFAEMLIGVPL